MEPAPTLATVTFFKLSKCISNRTVNLVQMDFDILAK